MRCNWIIIRRKLKNYGWDGYGRTPRTPCTKPGEKRTIATGASSIELVLCPKHASDLAERMRRRLLGGFRIPESGGAYVDDLRGR